jgi:hypothetical protein
MKTDGLTNVRKRFLTCCSLADATRKARNFGNEEAVLAWI